jgi:hypothetical protein
MTKNLTIIFGIAIFISCNILLASEDVPLSNGGKLELLSKAKISTISKQEIAEAATEESKKHAEDWESGCQIDNARRSWSRHYARGLFETGNLSVTLKKEKINS